MPQASFYILSADKKPLDFTCQLAQTVLSKSDDGLAIICPDDQLHRLDDKLWAFSDTAFIPHSILEQSRDSQPAIGVILTADSDFVQQFDGIVINIMDNPFAEFTGARLLEIISDDKKTIGREKYRVYQQLGWQLNTFQI